MNYFVTEGYKEVAERFAAETSTIPETSLEFIKERLKIRNLVQSGKIQEAIERVNDLYPEVMFPSLYMDNIVLCIKKRRQTGRKDIKYIFLILKILDTRPILYFHLQQQNLIELIRDGKFIEAIEFAQEELAPYGIKSVSLVHILFLDFGPLQSFFSKTCFFFLCCLKNSFYRRHFWKN